MLPAYKQRRRMRERAAYLEVVRQRAGRGGVHGDVDFAPASGQGEPLDLGKVATTAGAGVANIGTPGASA